MNKTSPVLFALAAALPLASADVRAEDGREGWYGGLDLGIAMPHDMDTRARDTDVPTNCDQHLDEATVNIDGTEETLPLPRDDPRCARGQDQWENRFDLDNGPLLGLNAGYAWRGLRVEAEYFYRQHGGEYVSGQNTSGNKQVEFIETGERIGDVSGHQFFGNIYYDFRDTGFKLIPYIGGGMGLMLARMDYSVKYHRNSDRNVIEGFGRNPNAAGTLTSEEEKLSNTLWGYQLETSKYSDF